MNIDNQVTINFKSGWIARDKNRQWSWFEDEPFIYNNEWTCFGKSCFINPDIFDIHCKNNWKETAFKVGDNN